MNFDKKMVFSAVNADELRVGDKVIVADTLDLIAMLVNTGKGEYWVIEEINPENFKNRFKARLLYHSCINKDYCYSFAFAYLVERAENCTNCKYAYLKDEGIECALNDEPKPTLLYEDAKLNRCRAWGKRAEPKTEQKAEHKCETCKYKNCGLKDCNTANICDRWEAEKHYRPFRDTNELIECWYEKKFPSCPGFARFSSVLTAPSIWVRKKNCTAMSDFITSYNGGGVRVCNEYKTFVELFDGYEFLDGSPCGVEVK